MPDMKAFLKCIGELKDTKNWSRERFGDIEKRYSYVYHQFMRDFQNDAQAAKLATDVIIREMQQTHQLKLNQALSQMRVETAWRDAFTKAQGITLVNIPLPKGREFGLGVDVGRGEGGKIAVIPKAFIEDQVRVDGVLNVHTAIENYQGKYWGMFDETVGGFFKKMFAGRALNKAHLPNIVRALFGEKLTDTAATALSDAYKKVQGVWLNDFRFLGGAIHELTDFHLPQWQTAVRLRNAGQATWVQDHLGWLDWSKTVHPNGTLIPQAEREAVLQQIYTTMSTGGKISIDDSVGGYQGKAMGNMLDNERFLHYKDAESWMAMNEKYMDGDVLDTIERHINKMVRKNALMQVLGPNPASGVKILGNIARKEAAKIEAAAAKDPKAYGRYATRATAETEAGLKRYGVMTESLLHDNPMDEESRIASTVHFTTNLATSAMLKSMVFLAVAGDLATTLAIRFAQHQSLTGFMGTYMRTMFPGGARENSLLMNQVGFIQQELVAGNYIAARYGTGAMYGPNISRKISDATMRLTLAQRHTIALRSANQREIMGSLASQRNVPFDQVREVALLRRVGITPDEWDFVRANMPIVQPVHGVDMFNPLGIFDMPNTAHARTLYNKFAGMIHNESQRMVPSTSIEANSILKSRTRPDTAAGAILYSAAMFKGYPMTAAIQYSKLAVSLHDGMSRMKLIGGLGLGMVVAGAVATQVRGLVQGQTMQPMDDPKFWLRALLNGGSFAYWGDFLTGAQQGDISRQIGSVAGPFIQELAEAIQITAGAALQWGELSDRVGDFSQAKASVKWVQFAKKYVIPQTFYTSLAFERLVLDGLQEWLDPQGTERSWRATRQHQKKVRGVDYWSAPGSGIVLPLGR